jgi:hypothetical protein
MQKLEIPKDWWLKFGCFLSGHSYQLLSECSEASKKYVRKLTSALLIIMIIWSMIGYLFATRYTDGGIIGGIFGAVFAGVIIVQIERQIILGKTEGSKLYFTLLFRLLLGIIVAIIGALILDQVFFKNDIAKEKEDLIDIRIAERVAKVQLESNKAISGYDSTIVAYNQQIEKNNQDISKSGLMINTTSNIVIDTAGNRTITNTKGANPLLIDNQNLREQIQIIENAKLAERNSLFGKIEAAKEKTRNEPPGFLDELNIIYDLASSSTLSAFAYFLFLFFFIFIELFIVIAKMMDGDNDYNKVMKYQEKIREERLKILEQKRSASLGENSKIDLSNELVANLPK